MKNRSAARDSPFDRETTAAAAAAACPSYCRNAEQTMSQALPRKVRGKLGGTAIATRTAIFNNNNNNKKIIKKL